MEIFAILIGLFYLICFLGAIILLIWTINKRRKEKKKEKEEFKDYDKY